ncbi:MAG: hypothetical protein IK041_06050 [Bacteroidales bacterium]|nr:hypothetical protein [Bacteroidales bacterium]
MADFNIDPRMKVKTLKADFKKAFGATLRVYTTKACKQFANDDATLAEIKDPKAKGGKLAVGGNTQVGTFENKLSELFGIGVQVANADDSKLADNKATLTAAGK